MLRHKCLLLVELVLVVEGLVVKLALARLILLLGHECVGQGLHLGSSAGNDFAFLNLKKSSTCDLIYISAVSFAVFLVLLVDVQKQFLQLIARQLVLIIEPRADTEMQRFFRLLLSWSLFETRPLSPQPQFDHIGRVRVFAARLNDSLHVTPFCPDQSPCHLELFIVRDLDVEPAGILYACIVVVVFVLVLVIVLRRHHERCRVVRVLEHIFVFKHGLHFLFWLLFFRQRLQS